MSIQSWKQLNSKTVHSSRWLTLRQDTCQLPNGKVIDDYFVVAVPDGVTVIAITKENQILLVRQYKHGYGRSVIELPAGLRESNERPEEAIRRELEEEIGYRADELTYVTTLITKPARMAARTWVYYATDVQYVTDPKTTASEIIECVKVPVKDLSSLIQSGEIVSETSLAALMTVWHKLDTK